MIISASRRTDIPAYYADWFFARVRAGYVDVRNPYRPRQVSRICLTPDAVDAMVFWTKNPLPMLGRLCELSDFAYYFQFTLTPYGQEVEPGLPSKREVLLPAFRRLAERAGPDRVVWRYDPVLLTREITPDVHCRCFRAMAQKLEGTTDECIVSFVDDYACSRRRMKRSGAAAPTREESAELTAYFAETAKEHGMRLSLCCESALLAGLYPSAPHGASEPKPFAGKPRTGGNGRTDVSQARCIDPARLSRITCRCRMLPGLPGDSNQREGCGCARSVDIGAYDTCRNGCIYCYACHSADRLAERCAQHDSGSSLLYGHLSDADEVTVRSSP